MMRLLGQHAKFSECECSSQGKFTIGVSSAHENSGFPPGGGSPATRERYPSAYKIQSNHLTHCVRSQARA